MAHRSLQPARQDTSAPDSVSARYVHHLADVLTRVAAGATDILPDSVGRIWVVENETLVVHADARTGLGHHATAALLECAASWAHQVASTREVLVVEEEAGVSAMTVPLVVRDVVVGVLSVMSVAAHRLTASERDRIAAFGSHAALAIHNATLHTEAEHRRLAAETLADVGRLVSQSLDLDEVGQRIVDSVHTLFDAAAAALYRWDTDLDDLIAIAVSGDWGPVLEHVVFPAGTGILGLAMDQRRVVTSADVLYDSRLTLTPRVRARLDGTEARALLAVPLSASGRTVGALVVARRVGERFDDDDGRLAEAFGDQAAIALENARRFEAQGTLLDALDQRRRRLEALVEVSREVSKIQPLPALLRTIADTCATLLGTDSVGVRLVEGDELVLAFASGGAKEIMATPRLKVGESISGRVAATGEPLVGTDADDHSMLPAHREALRRLGYRALLAVPITKADRTVGVLSVQTQRRSGFSNEDIEIVTAFAAQVGVAISNAQLYQETCQAYQRLEQTQDQLLQSQKMDAIGRLAGGVAHDFNNLLTVIMGHGQLLMRQLPEGSVRTGIDRINQAGERAADLTRQLLAFSRKQLLAPRVLQLSTVVERLLPLLQRVIGEDVEVRYELPRPPMPIKADPSQMEQVIMNLAVNARDAMPAGGTLTLAIEDIEVAPGAAELAAGRYVRLAVTDTGVGMDPDTCRRMYEPFFTTKEPGKGTGLGMAMVYGIVQQSGGHVAVSSEIGRGTSFHVFFPAVAEPVEAAVPPPASVPERGSETVLLVEDQQQVRQLVRMALEAAGYTVIEAADAEEALERADDPTRNIDLLLTDVVMPHMNGRVLAEVLTATHPTVKVLFMSGYTDSALLDGTEFARALIRKPFTLDALGRAVRAALRGDNLTPSAPSPLPAGTAG